MGKFYWLKLKKDFFKRHDIRIIEDMKDGGKMVLFYLKLLCESVDHDGALRFSDEVPYDNDMLASVTNTDKSVVDEAMKILMKLGMVKIEEDGTIIMCGADSMLGSETAWAEKKRQQRGQSEDKARTMSPKCPLPKGTMSDKRKRKSIEIEKEIEKEEEIDNDKSLSLSSRREIPTKDAVIRFAHDQKINKIIDAEQFWTFYNDQEWKIEGKQIRNWKSLMMKWASNIKERKNITEKFMENEYSTEHLQKREEESLKLLDELLEE